MDMKLDYYEDVQLLHGKTAKVWFLLLLIALTALPFMIKGYYVYIISLMAVNIIVALGLNLLVGNTGQISLGHAGFVAIGAYTTAILMISVDLPFIPAMIAGGVVAAFFGFLLGLPALRLEGPYLAIATLAFGLAITTLIGRVAFFGGHMGLSVPAVRFDLLGLTGDESIYYVAIITSVLLGIFARNFLKTRPGRAFQAVRDSDIAAAAMGINVSYYKTLSFAVSAFYAGIAGGLWAILIGFINPGLFNFMLSILYLATVVVGGLGTILGSVMGAVVITFLNLQLENVQSIAGIGQLLEAFSIQFMTLSGLPNIVWVLTGLILILIVVFEPLGLYGIWYRIKIYWKTWPF